jgi:1-deoxy-D-xylulose-5-phosphate reductoisomerase
MVVLGSTGSIGKNTLKIAKKFNIEIEALVAGNNAKELNKQIKKFKPKYVVVKDKETAKKINFKDIKYGKEAILEVIEKSKSDLIVNALVGESGLEPTLFAQKLNKKIALANKESLVIAGKFIDISKITPIDSEHFSLWYLLKDKSFKKLYITASGGALRDWKIKDLKKATIKDVLKHPNWKMGVKITIDSATMVNKLFELVEARWLFNTSKIKAIIEPTSTIHALVEHIDGSISAHLSKTDMKLPIAYAILNKVDTQILKPLNLYKLNISFKKISKKRYPIWEIKKEVLKNPQSAAIVNFANEFLIEKFLQKKIGFVDISKRILKCYEKFKDTNISSIEDIKLLKKEVISFCKNYQK